MILKPFHIAYQSVTNPSSLNHLAGVLSGILAGLLLVDAGTVVALIPVMVFCLGVAIAGLILRGIPGKTVSDAVLAGFYLPVLCAHALVFSALLAVSWPLRAGLRRIARKSSGEAVPEVVIDAPSQRIDLAEISGLSRHVPGHDWSEGIHRQEGPRTDPVLG